MPQHQYFHGELDVKPVVDQETADLINNLFEADFIAENETMLADLGTLPKGENEWALVQQYRWTDGWIHSALKREEPYGWAEWREWLEFIIEKILKPRGYAVSGELTFEGEHINDTFIVRVDHKGIVNYNVPLDSRVIYVGDLKLQPAGIDYIIRRLKRLHGYDRAMREERGLDDVITLLERWKEVL